MDQAVSDANAILDTDVGRHLATYSDHATGGDDVTAPTEDTLVMDGVTIDNTVTETKA